MFLHFNRREDLLAGKHSLESLIGTSDNALIDTGRQFILSASFADVHKRPKNLGFARVSGFVYDFSRSPFSPTVTPKGGKIGGMAWNGKRRCPTMKLTDIACKTAQAADKAKKLSDGFGLYLEVIPNGRKYWRRKSGKDRPC